MTECNDLIVKVGPKHRALVSRTEDKNKIEELNASYNKAQMVLKEYQQLLEEVESEFKMAANELGDKKYADAVYDRRVETKKPSKKKKTGAPKAVQASQKKRKRLANMFFTLALLIAAYQYFFVIRNQPPVSYSDTDLSQVLPIYDVKTWENWIFANITKAEWEKIPADQRQQKANELVKLIEAKGYDSLEVKLDGKMWVISTLEVDGRKLVRVAD